MDVQFEENKKKIFEELKKAGYESFEDLSLRHNVHKDYAEFFAPVCENLFELKLRMTAIKQIPIWNKTKFTGLNPDFDYEAKKLGYENLNHVAKQYEKYGYDTFHFCTLSADYKDLKAMISFFDNIEKNNEKFGISMKWYIKRIKSESQTHMKIDKMYRMVLLRVFLKDGKDYKWMQKNLA